MGRRSSSNPGTLATWDTACLQKRWKWTKHTCRSAGSKISQRGQPEGPWTSPCLHPQLPTFLGSSLSSGFHEARWSSPLRHGPTSHGHQKVKGNCLPPPVPAVKTASSCHCGRRSGSASSAAGGLGTTLWLSSFYQALAPLSCCLWEEPASWARSGLRWRLRSRWMRFWQLPRIAPLASPRLSWQVAGMGSAYSWSSQAPVCICTCPGVHALRGQRICK